MLTKEGLALHILIFGATGGTGRELVRQALEGGHDATAFVRRQTINLPMDQRLHFAIGSFEDRETLDRALQGQDVVISALGSDQKGPTTVCTDAMRAILAAMQRQGVRRLLAVSAHGAAESRDTSLYTLAVWAKVGKKIRDMEGMEELIRVSDTDWTIARPPHLINGRHTTKYRVGLDVKIRLTSKISRADLASFLLSAAADGTFIHATPRVAW
jgi:putative NADH-flavin reductase